MDGHMAEGDQGGVGLRDPALQPRREPVPDITRSMCPVHQPDVTCEAGGPQGVTEHLVSPTDGEGTEAQNGGLCLGGHTATQRQGLDCEQDPPCLVATPMATISSHSSKSPAAWPSG